MPRTKPPTFDVANAQITSAALELHHALRDALDQVLPPGSGARACGRALGLRRQLGWQIYSIAHTADHAAVIRALPKRRGWELVLDALRERGYCETSLRVLRSAIQRLDAQLGNPHWDRSIVRAVAAGALDSATDQDAMLRARKQATQANELIHGVGQRHYVSSFLVGPAGPRNAVGMAAVTSIHGLRRIRPGAAWPVYYTLEAYSHEAPTRGVLTASRRGGGITPLAADLSSHAAVSGCLRMRQDGETNMVELLDRGEANAQPLDLAFVEHVPKVGVLTEAPSPWRLMFLLTTPSERAVTEIWIHRSLRLANDPAAMLMSAPILNRRVLAEHTLERLPLESSAIPIERPTLPPAMRRHAATHGELLARGAKRLDSSIGDFVGFQLEITNPPWMSMLAMLFDCGRPRR
jgi:hypothetical protein